MSALSAYLENKLSDHILGAVTYTPPATVYIALFTTLPNESGTGGVEVSGGSYARVAVANNATNWPAATNGSKKNGTVISFPTPTADWGNVTGFGIYDAATGGNLLFFAPLDATVTVLNGGGFNFPVNAIELLAD
jgi:hypothetical protein